MKTITINKNDANQRLDKFLSKVFRNMPWGSLYKYIRKKRIKVNKKGSDINYVLKEGDILELYINDEFFESEKKGEAFLLLKNVNIDIAYEDENIIIVNKPAGLVVHEDEKESLHTLINYIKSYLYNRKEYDPEKENSFAPALCHRIDRNTSGLVIATKNAESLRIINEKIKKREIRKIYRCLLWGTPPQKSGTLKGYLFKDSKLNRVYVRQTPEKGAVYAETIYKIIETKNNIALTEVELITGRTHQIRAQFAHLGFPLLGDGKYAEAKKMPATLKHQALCAYKIIFDFKEGAGILDYLRGKEVTCGLESIMKYI